MSIYAGCLSNDEAIERYKLYGHLLKSKTATKFLLVPFFYAVLSLKKNSRFVMSLLFTVFVRYPIVLISTVVTSTASFLLEIVARVTTPLISVVVATVLQKMFAFDDLVPLVVKTLLIKFCFEIANEITAEITNYRRIGYFLVAIILMSLSFWWFYTPTIGAKLMLGY